MSIVRFPYGVEWRELGGGDAAYSGVSRAIHVFDLGAQYLYMVPIADRIGKVIQILPRQISRHFSLDTRRSRIRVGVLLSTLTHVTFQVGVAPGHATERKSQHNRKQLHRGQNEFLVMEFLFSTLLHPPETSPPSLTHAAVGRCAQAQWRARATSRPRRRPQRARLVAT